MTDKDVTKQVDFQWSDDECLPITKCVCGKEYKAWKFIISIYRDNAYECPNCHRRLYFRTRTRVYEVVDDEQ